MAQSKCLGCGHGTFELKVDTPSGSNSKVCLIQCAQCGGVIGVQDFRSAETLLIQQNRVLKLIGERILGMPIDIPI